MNSGYLGTRGNQRSAHREEMRASVVAAALKLFLERGHLAVAVEDIVDEVGISRATFYKYFDERDEILAELFSQLLTEPPPEPPVTGTPIARLCSLLVDTAQLMVANEDLARFVYSVPLRHDAILPGGLGQPLVMQSVHRLVVEGMNAGVLRDDVPAELLSQHLARSFEAAMREWATGMADDAAQQVGMHLDVAVNGVNKLR